MNFKTDDSRDVIGCDLAPDGKIGYVSDFSATRKTIDGLREHKSPVGNSLLHGIKWGQIDFCFDREHLNISFLQKYQQANVDVQFQKE